MRLNSSLSAKLLLAFASSSFVAVLICGALSYRFASNIVQEITDRDLTNRVRDTELTIRALLNAGLSPQAAGEKLRPLLKSVRILQTGYFFILDPQGNFILHPQKEGQNVIRDTDLDGRPIFKEMLEKKSGRIEYRWLNGETKAPQQKAAIFAFNPDTQWLIVASLNLDEVNGSVHSMRIVMALICSAMIAAAAVFALFWSRSLKEFFLGISKRLLGTSTSLQASSKLVSDASHRLSEATTEQAAAIQETASAVEEIKVMVSRNAEHSQSSDLKVQEAVASAEQGKAAVVDLRRAIEEIVAANTKIQKQVETGNQEMTKIVEVIREIDQKTKVINDIVFQTKLLSFNASVEAARAGEQGKGFAVVAEEVGNLARMSGKAAAEISSMLAQSTTLVETIINQSRSAVTQLIEESGRIVAKGSERAEHCDEAFVDMATKVAEIQTYVSNIASASKEQSAGVDEIGKSMAQLDQAMNSNAATSNETALASVDLSHQNETLVGLAHELAWSILGETAKAKLDADTEKVIDAGLKAHAEWKNRLVRVLNGTSTDKLDPSVVGRDDQCALGKWIHDKGQARFGNQKLFVVMKEKHAHFHQAAARVLTVAQQDGCQAAAKMIDRGSEFDQRSQAVITDLVSLKFS